MAHPSASFTDSIAECQSHVSHALCSVQAFVPLCFVTSYLRSTLISFTWFHLTPGCALLVGFALSHLT
jgi:hypothetical protein